MKMTFNRMGWLVMAAAFIMSFAACSNDDNETNVQPQTIHVSVDAGLGNDGTTRSEMITESGKRVLTFTEGDRLYVYEDLGGYLCLAGYLTMKDGSLAADGKSAAFEGDLKVYDYKTFTAVETSYDFGDADPLAAGADAYLVHKNMIEGDEASGAHYFISNSKRLNFNLKNLIASDVETLMESALPVWGLYNSATKTFELSSHTAIFNVHISGVVANQDYNIDLRDSDGDLIMGYSYTSDDTGVINCAFVVYCNDYGAPYKLQIANTSNWSDDKTFELANNKIEAKIYNITRTWN